MFVTTLFIIIRSRGDMYKFVKIFYSRTFVVITQSPPMYTAPLSTTGQRGGTRLWTPSQSGLRNSVRTPVHLPCTRGGPTSPLTGYGPQQDHFQFPSWYYTRSPAASQTAQGTPYRSWTSDGHESSGSAHSLTCSTPLLLRDVRREPDPLGGVERLEMKGIQMVQVSVDVPTVLLVFMTLSVLRYCIY